jgi:hypothetical protein
MKTILDVIKEELVQLPQFLKIVLRHLGLNNYLSLPSMTEADFTEICGSEFLAETDFYEYYTENVVVTLINEVMGKEYNKKDVYLKLMLNKSRVYYDVMYYFFSRIKNEKINLN